MLSHYFYVNQIIGVQMHLTKTFEKVMERGENTGY